MKGGRLSRGWMVVSGLRYRDQTNRNRPSSKRFIPILNSKKERIKELETQLPKSVYALSEDEADDYDSATDDDEPDEVDTNNESSKKDLLAFQTILYL